MGRETSKEVDFLGGNGGGLSIGSSSGIVSLFFFNRGVCCVRVIRRSSVELRGGEKLLMNGDLGSASGSIGRLLDEAKEEGNGISSCS